MDWELKRQRNQAQINKDTIRKNRQRVDYGYKVRDNVMLNKHTAYKYETTYMDPFVITQCFTNGMVKFKNGVTQFRYNTRSFNPYKSDAKVEDYSSKKYIR